MMNLASKTTTQNCKLGTHSLMTIASLILVVLLAFLGSTAGKCQGITGSITGTVIDPSGAVVAGATVTVRNIDTNAVRIVTTSDAGSYTVTQLPPGHYAVKVDKAGFKAYSQSGITLAIDQVAQINAQLVVGSEAQNIEVTSTGPVIQTEDSSVGQVIDSHSIQNTPLNGRLSVMGLIALSPGVQGVGAQDQLAVRGLTYAVGTGSRNAYGGLGSTLDGVVNKEVTLQRAEPEVPSLDALAEFKVLSTGAPAEFNEPSQVIVVTASGTNQYHGELLWYNRSKGTAAKTYFGGSSRRPYYERNEYGGNFAGPIKLPGYNGKDRSFFFVAFEGFRLNQSANVNSQQPTTKMRSGDFSEFLDANGDGNCTQTVNGANPGYYCIYDPTTGQKFPGNIIPNFTSRLNSVSGQLLNLLYPKPTQSGTGTNTFELVPYTSQAKRFSLHIDHKISDKDQIRGTFMEALYGPNPDVGVSSLQGGFSGDGEHNTNTILGWTHTFSPTLLIDTYASYFHLPIYRTPQNVGTKWESIIPGLSPQLIEGAPQITITNITNVAEQGSKDLEQVIQANTAVTKVFAHHTIKAGFSYIFDNHWNESAVTPQRGSFSFNGRYTTDPGTPPQFEKSGIAFADFLLGLPVSTGQGTPGTFITRNVSSQYAAFIQDDWKVMPRLTVNMGIRYDLQWFEPGPYGESSLYVPSLNKVVVFGSSYPSGAISSYVNSLSAAGLITLSSTAGISNNPFAFLGRPDKNFAPRLGFAYQVLSNTVLRGAYGIYFNLLPASYVGNMFGTLPFEASQSFSNTTTYSASTFTMSNPFSASGTFSANPNVNAQHSLVTPYTEEYNLAIEHQFPGALDLRVGYVGQHNLKQNNYGGGGNYAPNINLADPPQVGVNAQTTNLHQPFASIPYNLDPLFHSMMNSLQVGVHKQFTHGLAFGAEYQWTRVLGTENLEDPSGQHPRDSYGPIGGITPQVLQVSYSYGLPFGRGHMLFGSSGDVTNKLINGWQISGITDAQTGQPFSVSYSAAGIAGLVSGRANQVGNPYQSGTIAANPTCTPPAGNTRTRAQWFNPCAFVVPPCYNSNGSFTCASYTMSMPTSYATYGTSGYNMLRGPRFQDWDMSLQKNIPWHDHYNVQLRADSFNVFNHPNFGTPNANISNSNKGTITGISSTPSYEQRTLEFAMKFNF